MPVRLHSITPFFIVDDLDATLHFYIDHLGFEVLHKGGGDSQTKDFWAIVQRDAVLLQFKHITPELHPQPNHTRHQGARWDAFVSTSDPDALFAEYQAKAVPIHSPLADTGDGLRAFEVLDNNGYVLCFGCPLDN